jgi:hypothetical protein
MAQARRVSLFEREIHERLSRAAIDILVDGADVLSEGQRDPKGRRYYGSTMLTIDLLRHAALLREPCDAVSARRVAALFQKDARAASRVRLIADREARRLCGGGLGRVAVELRFRWEGARVFVDVDVEGALA